MCRVVAFELKCKEEEEQSQQDRAILLLQALIFIIRTNQHIIAFDEEDGRIDLLSPQSSSYWLEY